MTLIPLLSNLAYPPEYPVPSPNLKLFKCESVNLQRVVVELVGTFWALCAKTAMSFRVQFVRDSAPQSKVSPSSFPASSWRFLT